MPTRSAGCSLCFDRDGKVVWSRSLTEEFGRISGYGGRVHTPVVDEDLVIISYLSSNWGSHTPGRHRYFAFDKRSGELVWIATPGGGRSTPRTPCPSSPPSTASACSSAATPTAPSMP